MDIDPPPPAPPSSIFPDLDLKFRSQKNVAHVFLVVNHKEFHLCGDGRDDDAEVDQEITLPCVCAVMAGTMRTKSTTPPSSNY
ncbi:hypothetical protein LXL04_006535 [Taraxacum kok-saghyz]